MVFSKTRVSIHPGLLGPLYTVVMVQLLMLHFTVFTRSILVNTINYKVILAKIRNNPTTAVLPSFALNGKYNCIGIGMQYND